MTYEELSPEMQALFNAYMQDGNIPRAMALLNPPKPLTPDEQAEVDRQLAKMEKSNKRFSKAVTATFVVVVAYLVWSYVIN